MKLLCRLQNKYKEDGQKSQSVSVYSQLQDTNDIQFARAVSELQSQVRSCDLQRVPRELLTDQHTSLADM